MIIEGNEDGGSETVCKNGTGLHCEDTGRGKRLETFWIVNTLRPNLPSLKEAVGKDFPNTNIIEPKGKRK